MSKTLIPWALLGLLVLYRRTWGACDCDALGRRLAVAHRETKDWQNEARFWASKYAEEFGWKLAEKDAG